MDVSRYNFKCQKALHLGWRLARKLNHANLEVEHVALSFLQNSLIELDDLDKDLDKKKIEKMIHAYLVARPRVVGIKKVEFGPRLDRALDKSEDQKEVVDEVTLWKNLIIQSTILKHATSKTAKNQKEPTTDDLLKIEDEVFKAFEEEEFEKSNSPKSDKDAKENKKLKNLEKYAINLRRAHDGELDPVIGRDEEVRRVLEVLGRKRKNNPLLTGPAGVGKTAIIEALAQRISSGKVPATLARKQIYSLDLNSMLAGARYRGDFEERLKGVMEDIKKEAGRIILFIDEIHSIVGAGRGEGTQDAANILKPSLARGELHCIGATTTQEYRKYIEKDPALVRRFQSVNVREPSPDITTGILRGLKPHYEVHHGVQVDDEAVTSAVQLSVRYLPERNLPDKAIDLIDEAASRLRLEIESRPAMLEQLGAKISRMEVELQQLKKEKITGKDAVKLQVYLDSSKKEYEEIEQIWKTHKSLLDDLRVTEARYQEFVSELEKIKAEGEYEGAARIQYEEMPELEGKLSDLRGKLHTVQNSHKWLSQVVGKYEIASVLAQWTSIPIDKLMKEDNERLLTMEQRISKRVVGQEPAIESICRSIKRAKAGIQNPDRPLGVFLLAGPTGVGKTETAKALADELFDDPACFIRIDMSEYMEQHSVARLIGSPPGYAGHGESGELCEKVRRRPYSLVLFDEIEKAHPRVLDVMLQLFDDGRLTDGEGRTVDFRNTLILLTSNLLQDLVTFGGVSSEFLRKELSGELRPELVNRIDEVVGFSPLGGQQFEKILGNLVEGLNSRLQDRHIRLVLSEKMKTRLLRSEGSEMFGARMLQRKFRMFIEDELALKLLENPSELSGVWEMDIDEDDGIHWRAVYEPQKYLPAAGG
jgi:ATP-dependent Clp protease ATP-binding subunit ClpB